MRRTSFIFLIALLALPALVALSMPAIDRRPQIRPTIPDADRQNGDRVFLERADVLRKAESDSFMILVGDVIFTKGPMTMRCDSAHYFPDNESMQAFGNVSMEQGDTLFVFADELDYNGPTQIATLYADFGKKVELINRDVKLETDIFIYDLAIDLGYYEVGGRLTDPSNTLTSIYGEYAPSTKEANFYTDVCLHSLNNSDTLDIYTDTLYYNTVTRVAQLFSPSTIINPRGTVYTTRAIYDTDSNFTWLFDRSTAVTSDAQTITADSIYYNRAAGFSEAFGRMIMTDTANNVEVHADYGFFNELTDSAFITGHAELREFSEADTLYLHGRYIEAFRLFDTIQIAEDTVARTPASERVDTSHVAVIYPRVRFFRRDMQGVCDSMRFTQRDTTLRMYINPVVWNEEQQIFGNIIEVKMNDSTIERATLPDQGFTAQHIEGPHYNQLAGKEMVAHFKKGEMRRLDINGSVQIIMYPEESDSTINKIVNAESSYLTGWFKGRTTEKIKMWPQTTGTATPLFMAKKSLYYLPKFKWHEAMRPRDRFDIFTVPDYMEELMIASGRPPAIPEESGAIPEESGAIPEETDSIPIQ